MEYLDTVQDFKLEEIKKILIKNSDPFKIILFGSDQQVNITVIVIMIFALSKNPIPI
jgi:hypothetical protein